MAEQEFKEFDVEKFEAFDELCMAAHSLYYHATNVKLDLDNDATNSLLETAIAETVVGINKIMSKGYVDPQVIEWRIMGLESHEKVKNECH